MKLLQQTFGISCRHTHPDVLEEPGAHDVGGVFGKDAAFVLGGVVVVIEQVDVLVELQLKLSTDVPSEVTCRSSDTLDPKPEEPHDSERTEPSGTSWT